jgi:hypothetical protein
MPFINMPLGDAEPREVLDEGRYLVRCEDAEYVGSKTHPGQTNIRVRCSFPEHPNAKSVFHHIAGIGPEDDKEKINNKLLMARAFLDTFGVEYDDSGFELDAIPGCETEVNVKQEEYEGQLTNRIVLQW